MFPINRTRGWLVLTVLLLGLNTATRLSAADSVFSATVPNAAGDNQQRVFADALGRVLVKLTGRPGAANDPALRARFSDPAALVQQYRSTADGDMWVRFDGAAIQRILDASGERYWAAERPATLVWLALDMGGGNRDILSADSAGDSSRVSGLRAELNGAADVRGLPVILPLMDSGDVGAVSFSDVWGEFGNRLRNASARYEADALLIGRARIYPGERPRVRWTYLSGAERLEWEGSVADGPNFIADQLMARLATSADSSQTLRVQVDGINDIDGYGRVSSYLTSLGAVESCNVVSVDGARMIFDLRFRGDSNRLMRSIEMKRLLLPVNGGGDVALTPGQRVDLRYRLSDS